MIRTMKAKIRKTGEIVDIISYNDISTTSISKYLVTYIDSLGVEHGREGTDYHFDFEPIDNLTHWQDVRERAAIAAMQGTITILGSSDRNAFRDIVAEGFRGDKKTYPNEIAEFAVACAKSLVEELKKK